MAKIINVGGRLHSTEVGNTLTGANEILDDVKGKKQNVINSEVSEELTRLEQSKQDNLTFDNTPTENSTNPVTSGGVYAADKTLSDAIDAILVLIPSAASALNQLADKAFVNSTEATNTATFRGTSATGLTEQQFLDWADSLTHDKNDYVFWQTIDAAGNTLFKRYKYDGTQWLYEYTLNNSSFTADQWAAIMSGITAALVEKLQDLPTATEIQTALNGKQATLTFDNVPVSGSDNPVKSGGVWSKLKDITDLIPAAATNLNQLSDKTWVGNAIAEVINALDATITVNSSDGHVGIAMTQVDGKVTQVVVSTNDIASASALSLLGGRVTVNENAISNIGNRMTTAEGNITSLTGRVSTNEADIAALQAAYAALTQSDPVIIQPTDTWPVANPQQDIIYRVVDRVNTPPQYYTDYMWNGTAMVKMAQYNNAIDDVPTAGSNNLVKSGGLYNAFGAAEFDNSAIGHRAILSGEGNENVNRYGDVGKMYGIVPGHNYRICIINPDVDMTGVTYTGSKFAIWVDEDTYLLSVDKATNLNNYYDVLIPEGKTTLWISCRCASGAKLSCYIYDLTRYNNTIIAKDSYILFTGWNVGYYIPTLSVGDTLDLSNMIENGEFECAILDCQEGDKFLVNNYFGGGSARAVCFIDSENKVLSQSDTGSITNQVFVAPANAAKVIFNNNQDHHGSWLDYYTFITQQVPDSYLKLYATKQYVDEAIGGYDSKIVDLLVFAGQSNMAGRGATNASHPESYPSIIEGAGYEYRAISDNSKLYPIMEPFGVNENKNGGINDGSAKTGSPVTAFVNAYYKESHTTVVGVSASQGGSRISQWQTDGVLLPDALQRFSDAISFLTTNGYTINHKYVVWLQGESDGDDATTKENYKTLLTAMFSSFKALGAEKLLLIRIGKRSYDEAYKDIIDAQTELCKSSDDVIMISTALSDFRRRGFMKDSYHYYQDGYNLIGQYAGHNAGVYARFGIERIQYDSEDASNIYNSFKCD